MRLNEGEAFPSPGDSIGDQIGKLDGAVLRPPRKFSFMK